jgi:hypothetical protein
MVIIFNKGNINSKDFLFKCKGVPIFISKTNEYIITLKLSLLGYKIFFCYNLENGNIISKTDTYIPGSDSIIEFSSNAKYMLTKTYTGKTRNSSDSYTSDSPWWGIVYTESSKYLVYNMIESKEMLTVSGHKCGFLSDGEHLAVYVNDEIRNYKDHHIYSISNKDHAIINSSDSKNSEIEKYITDNQSEIKKIFDNKFIVDNQDYKTNLKKEILNNNKLYGLNITKNKIQLFKENINNIIKEFRGDSAYFDNTGEYLFIVSKTDTEIWDFENFLAHKYLL